MSLKIRSLLVLNGVKQNELANKLKVSPPAVSRVVYGKSTSKRIRRAIAEALKMRPEQLWPPDSVRGQKAA